MCCGILPRVRCTPLQHGAAYGYCYGYTGRAGCAMRLNAGGRVAEEAGQLEAAMVAAGLDPDGALSWPIWDQFTNRGLRAAMAALTERDACMETKLERKPLVGQRQERSAPRGAELLTAADRAHMRSGGRVLLTKNADGSTTKSYARGPASGAPRSARSSTPKERPPSPAELQAIHDRWLSPEGQLVADTRAYTTLVDEALELNERRRRGR